MNASPDPSKPFAALRQGWRQFGARFNWAETRTQILLCYMGLMLLFVGIAIPVVYRALFRDIERRLYTDVADEVQEFIRAVVKTPPQSLADIQRLADRYTQDELIEPGQYFIFILEEEFYRSSPANLPQSIQPGSALMQQWQMLKRPTQSAKKSDESAVGEIVYQVEPIFLQGQVAGLFVAVHTSGKEQQEVRQILRSAWGALLVMLAIAAGLAWLISGRILQPLRSMTEVARSISEADLSKRLPVVGQGEMAQVATTFNEMMDRLESAFHSQQNFINDASHELRTPITIIQGHLDLMSDDPEEQREVLALVNDELSRINRFVNDLLTLAKSGRPDFIQLEPVELEPFTEELYQKVRVIAQCNCELDGVATGSAQLDRQRITQAVLNLVENANQHTPLEGTIAIGSSKSRKNLRFWVRDTGRGISAKDQERIFERFARGSTSQRRSEGAGLGLSIVKAIASAQGGRVELKSKLGEGSIFTLVLPLRGQKQSKIRGIETNGDKN